MIGIRVAYGNDSRLSVVDCVPMRQISSGTINRCLSRMSVQRMVSQNAFQFFISNLEIINKY